MWLKYSPNGWPCFTNIFTILLKTKMVALRLTDLDSEFVPFTDQSTFSIDESFFVNTFKICKSVYHFHWLTLDFSMLWYISIYNTYRPMITYSRSVGTHKLSTSSTVRTMLFTKSMSATLLSNVCLSSH